MDKTRSSFSVEYGSQKIPLGSQIECINFIKKNEDADLYTVVIKGEIYEDNVWQHHYKKEITYIFGGAYFPEKIRKMTKDKICKKYKGNRFEKKRVGENLGTLEKKIAQFVRQGSELIILARSGALYQSNYKNLILIDEKGKFEAYSKVLEKKKEDKAFFEKQKKWEMQNQGRPAKQNRTRQRPNAARRFAS